MKYKHIHIGTSGWSYIHWKGPFYPAGLPNDQMLDFYMQHFQTIEINSSFYHLPQKQTLERWREAAFCICELGGFLSPKEITVDFIYVRLHGPNGAYQGSYNAQALASWADTFSAWASQGHTVYCYFDNDEAGYAAQNAERLKDMLYTRDSN